MRQLNTLPAKKKSFFAPIFTFQSALGRAWRLWSTGQDVQPPFQSSYSASGETLTVETALTISAVWACVFRYGTTISTLPLMLMQTGAKNSAQPATTHPLYKILHDRPNEMMSASAFWQALIVSMMLWGAGYARKLFAGNRLVGLLPLRPEYMTPYLLNGQLRYRYHPTGRGMVEEDFAADELFVVIDRTVDGYTGLSRIQYGSNALGLALSADKVSGNYYKNGLRASGLLTIAQWLKPEQRAAYRELLAAFTGTGTGAATDKQGGIMIAENATKFESLSMKPVDVELLAARQFSIEEICRWFDIPPILVGHNPAGQTMWGSGVEQIVLAWQKLGLASVVRRVEQEIWRQLLSPEDQDLYFAEFKLEGLLRGDTKSRAALYSSMAQNGIYSRNEIRAYENLPVVEGGDKITVQSNLVDLAKLGDVPAVAPAIGLDDVAEDDIAEVSEDNPKEGESDEIKDT